MRKRDSNQSTKNDLSKGKQLFIGRGYISRGDRVRDVEMKEAKRRRGGEICLFLFNKFEMS